MYGPGGVRIAKDQINARVTIIIQLDDGTTQQHSVAVHMEPRTWNQNGLAMRLHQSAEMAVRALGGKALWVG